MNIYFLRVIDIMKEKGFELTSMRPYVFKKNADTITFHTQAEAIRNVVKKQHRRSNKNCCIDCGSPIENTTSTSGTKRCRCDHCYKKYVKTHQEEHCFIYVRKEVKQKLLALGAKWELTYAGQVIEKLLEEKE